MKHLILIGLLIVSSLGFSQGTGMVVGKIFDKELNNEPLVFAHIVVKGVDTKATTDLTGLFLVENLSDGRHTLVCSYPGYESKELEVQIKEGQPAEINVAMSAKKLGRDTASESLKSQSEESSEKEEKK